MCPKDKHIQFEVFPNHEKFGIIQLEKAKKELLWYLICNGEQIRTAIGEIDFSPLSFDGPKITRG